MIIKKIQRIKWENIDATEGIPGGIGA